MNDDDPLFSSIDELCEYAGWDAATRAQIEADLLETSLQSVCDTASVTVH